MKASSKFVAISMTLLMSATMIMGGCAAKKPMTQTPGMNNIKNTEPANKYPKAVADKAVAEANKVNGVRGATAVVSGKNIYVGLDINANIEKSKTADVEKMALEKVKKVEPGYTCTVTSDVDTVTRIKKVSQGIGQGKPISTFNNEIKEIGNRLKARTR